MDALDLLTEDALLRRYVRTREVAVWEEIAVRNFDRIQGSVATFRFSPSRQPIPEPDHGEVAGLAWERVVAMGAGFRGASIGELRNAVAKAVWHACMDWGRKRIARERRIAGSLDEPAFEEEGAGSRFDAAVAAASRQAEAAAADDQEEWERRNSYVALARAAIGRVANDNYREVLHMTYVRKLDAEEIARQLGITLDNVYQRRRRGSLELEKILDDLRT